MSLNPEYILQTLLVRGFEKFRNDDRFISQLFRNLNPTQINNIKTLLKYGVSVEIGYPKASIKVPSVVLLLKSETETAPSLNDYLGEGAEDIFLYDNDETLGASVVSQFGASDNLFGPYQISSVSGNKVILDRNILVKHEFDYDDNFINYLFITSGKGKGKVFKILTNSKIDITLDSDVDAILDNTSYFVIKQLNDEIVGDPMAIYDRDTNTTIEKKGSIFAASYQLQVIGQSSEVTLTLTTLCKSLIYLGRLFLEKNGLKNLKINATDFSTVSSTVPTEAYIRSLNLDFLYEFYVYEPNSTLINEFNGSLEDSDGSVLISTSFEV